MNIKNLIDLNRENNDNNDSLLENDNISVSSSKYMSSKKNVKLPFIIGTNEFFRNEFLGVFNEAIFFVDSRKKKR